MMMMMTMMIIIMMEICKAPTLRLKVLNKHTHITCIAKLYQKKKKKKKREEKKEVSFFQSLQETSKTEQDVP